MTIRDYGPEDHKPQPTDFVCLAVSPDGYICNRKPKHDGDHIAYAGPGRVEVGRWADGDGKSARVRSPTGCVPGDSK